jgi:hypothetical protein
MDRSVRPSGAVTERADGHPVDRTGGEGPWLGPLSSARQPEYRLKTATAFCPPNPKPLTIATPTSAARDEFGT